MTIEQVDQVMEATGADYATVKAALSKHQGNVAAAIQDIKAEGKYEPSASGERVYSSDQFAADASQVAQKVGEVIREVWDKGQASSLTVEKDGRKIIELSLAVSAIGLILAPMAALFGLGLAFLTDYSIYITLKDGHTVDVGKEALARLENIR